MTKLLELLAEGRAYSVEDLADALDATAAGCQTADGISERTGYSAPRLRLRPRLQGLLCPLRWTRQKYAGHVGGHNTPNLKFKRKLR